MRKFSNYILVLALGAYAGTIASAAPAPDADQPRTMEQVVDRSEERRVGKECSSPCRSRWSPYH